MQKSLVRRLGLCTIVVACLCATMVAATAGGGPFTRGCAWRDLQILIMIEEREGASAGYTTQLSDAMLAMMHARIVCHEGSVVDALALYDLVAQSVTPIPRLSDKRIEGGVESKPMRPCPLQNLAGGGPSSRQNHMTLAYCVALALGAIGIVAGSMRGVDQTGAA
jgi:hypothetical protein